MRTLVDIPEKQLDVLRAIAAARKVSRAEILRQAINAFIEQHRPARDSAFGVWREQKVTLPGQEEPLPEDGLAYEEQLRSEW